MELPLLVRSGLDLLTHSNCNAIIDKAFDIMSQSQTVHISDSAEYSLVTILVLGYQQNYDKEQMREFLETHIQDKYTVYSILSRYVAHENEYITKTTSFGIALPHVTDANWTLRSDLSSSCYSVSSGNLSFNIDLESFDNKKKTKVSVVRFICTPEELQLFINKLKDIELNCDKLCK
ncbi:COMM domain-containing protein 3 [Sabethes cyaneus]|uniref:COMM domain-containing protein 3 n=1 Tax=Sabethes cyaneus TaxID=53552 RepID=UPI00237E301A|nr:COMM domain-containing protein 3 [Sabethes cyaneus]